MILAARKVLPVTSPPINHGAVYIEHGKVVAVGGEKEIIRKFPGSRLLDLGMCVLMPGLVNLHTHLDLSHLQGRISLDGGFFEWIESLVELKHKGGTKGLLAAADKALTGAIETGTTCIGDISSADAAIPSIESSGIRAVVFEEVLGLDNAKADTIFESLNTRLSHFKGLPERIRPGISPHATYSVSSSLLNRISEHTSSNTIAKTIHISETIDEMRYFTGKPSGFDGYMKKFGWDNIEQNRGRTPLQFLKEHMKLNYILAVHAVHVTKKDMTLLRKYGATVAHCPRSNVLLGVGRAPVNEMLECGINVGFGTDSLASNEDLDLWEEMRASFKYYRMEASKVIEMATINGARGLRLGEVTGSIEPGKYADLIAVETPASAKKDPSRELIMEAGYDNVIMTMVEGKPLHLSEELKGSYGL